ncbi:Wzz/FepE/Etk N-terminal domain-containing protein [Lichenihabitans psoromatis]|uniref:Wzz/FepE/Etk N-terminal domain-containing protein n=1 Tax=Lichenihabitans psoromatis TaxID=2528642 RepID=UPI003CCB61C3
MLAVLHANRRMLALWVLLCLALAGAYLYSTPPEYLASTQIILEPRRQFAGAQDAGPGSYPRHSIVPRPKARSRSSSRSGSCASFSRRSISLIRPNSRPMVAA